MNLPFKKQLVNRIKFYSKGMIVVMLASALAAPAWAFDTSSAIDLKKWGAITAPVYGTSETGIYAGAELFAGPNKFGSYFSGVIPNGKIVKPAGTTMQVGMNPLGSILTPDGKYLITTNDDEREGGLSSYQNPTNVGGYGITILDTATMKVASNLTTGKLFIGLQISGAGPYTLWASGGGDNDVKIFDIATDGKITPNATTPSIPIAPITPSNQGFVSNYFTDSATWAGNPVPSIPSGFSKTGAHITFPAGMALSPDGRFLYVACNGDDSVAVIDTTQKKVVHQVPVGYFPYGVSVSRDGKKVAVSNWGITEYKFANPTYDNSGKLIALGNAGDAANQPDGFYVPVTSTPKTDPKNPKSSSVSLLSAPGGDGSQLTLLGSLYEGEELDALDEVGDTHPSATAVVRNNGQEILYVTKANTDSLGVIDLKHNTKLSDFDLSPIKVRDKRFGDRFPLKNGHKRFGKRDANDDVSLYGSYPNAIVVSPDNKVMYVAEAGTNSVAVLSVKNPRKPELLGRIKTNWYPTGLALSSDGRYLYIVNAKGIGEDINPNIHPSPTDPLPTGLASDPNVDSNFIFGSAQKVDLKKVDISNKAVLADNFAEHEQMDTSIVPIGDGPSKKIKHVIFILRENKTFDADLGNLGDHFGPFASLSYNDKDGKPYTNKQFTGVTENLQTLASTFATAVNYYSDAEESDAGHQFSASGTSTDYTQKTLLVKSGRGLLVNKNFEPEDYPASGYIFNNAARNNVSFKDYGALVRIDGTDTGTSSPTTINDPKSGNVGYPMLNDDGTISDPLVNAGEVDKPTSGLGQTYFLSLPVLAILGDNNASGEPHLDKNYPGYNFNISDQRRALEFIKDFDRMIQQNKLPQFIYLYLPNDHTGSVQAPNASEVIPVAAALRGAQQVADNDVALGMVVNHIMQSPIYYNQATGAGCAIFITEDDAQSSLDHIHPHRTPLTVVSPYAKPGYVAQRHYSTASIVKTEELLLGLPPMNLGDLLATDLRELFQRNYNQITADMVQVNRTINYTTSVEGRRIFDLSRQLDIYDGPDDDSFRIGALTRMSMYADDLYFTAVLNHQLDSASYKEAQDDLYEDALKLIKTQSGDKD
jgi:YVTN family beta-propeller protein